FGPDPGDRRSVAERPDARREPGDLIASQPLQHIRVVGDELLGLGLVVAPKEDHPADGRILAAGADQRAVGHETVEVGEVGWAVLPPRPRSSTTPMANGSREPRVLVVDDEEHITELVAMGLGYNGFEVERVGSGRAALESIERRRPDLVVLDVMLPDLDGFE